MSERAVLDPVQQFACDLRAGLAKAGQKEIPSKYFYDDLGSALFEAISCLPEYGLTRADERLLRNHAHEIVGCIAGPVVVAELGSGTGRKTRPILEAVSRRGPTRYCPIEISPLALAACRREFCDLSSVDILPFPCEYVEGLSEIAATVRTDEHVLVLFLGSTIGNFPPPEDAAFLCRVRQFLVPGDALLLGADLEKAVPDMLAAYDDGLGVTAAFNLNLLARANRELHADFVLGQYEHLARFNPVSRSIEMHLRSRKSQTATVEMADFEVTLEEGETIRTETSHKYTQRELAQLAAHAGFDFAGQWVDGDWAFAETLLKAK